jgi:hypothetical protein
MFEIFFDIVNFYLNNVGWHDCSMSSSKVRSLFQNTVDKLVQRANASLLIGTSSWKEQFIEAITVSPGKCLHSPSCICTAITGKCFLALSVCYAHYYDLWRRNAVTEFSTLWDSVYNCVSVCLLCTHYYNRCHCNVVKGFSTLREMFMTLCYSSPWRCRQQIPPKCR